MNSQSNAVHEDHDRAVSPRGTSTERFKVQSDAIAAKVKDLLHEGNVRRITVKDSHGHTVIEIPVTAGVVAAVVAPVLLAVSAIAAVANDWEIEVHRAS